MSEEKEEDRRGGSSRRERTIGRRSDEARRQ